MGKRRMSSASTSVFYPLPYPQIRKSADPPFTIVRRTEIVYIRNQNNTVTKRQQSDLSQRSLVTNSKANVACQSVSRLFLLNLVIHQSAYKHQHSRHYSRSTANVLFRNDVTTTLEIWM